MCIGLLLLCLSLSAIKVRRRAGGGRPGCRGRVFRSHSGASRDEDAAFMGAAESGASAPRLRWE